jgi:hypothetical protein
MQAVTTIGLDIAKSVINRAENNRPWPKKYFGFF